MLSSETPESPKLVQHRRRWFQFGLRSIFVVITAVALWFGYYANWVRERRKADEWIASHPPFGSLMHSKKKKAFPWMLRVIGAEPRPLIWVSINPDDKNDATQVERIRELFPEADVFAYPEIPTVPF